MARQFVHDKSYGIRELIEIRSEYKTGHVPGIVVVLDGTVPVALDKLVGGVLSFRQSSGANLQFTISEAKDHLSGTSLFLQGKTESDVPASARVYVSVPCETEPPPIERG